MLLYYNSNRDDKRNTFKFFIFTFGILIIIIKNLFCQFIMKKLVFVNFSLRLQILIYLPYLQELLNSMFSKSTGSRSDSYASFTICDHLSSYRSSFKQQTNPHTQFWPKSSEKSMKNKPKNQKNHQNHQNCKKSDQILSLGLCFSLPYPWLF